MPTDSIVRVFVLVSFLSKFSGKSSPDSICLDSVGCTGWSKILDERLSGIYLPEFCLSRFCLFTGFCLVFFFWKKTLSIVFLTGQTKTSQIIVVLRVYRVYRVYIFSVKILFNNETIIVDIDCLIFEYT